MNNLPANAKRVFKGVIFDVWQWDQKMFDGTTKPFEVLRRPDTAVIIPVVGNKILVQKETQPDKPQPYLSLPGGRLDPGEQPLAAAKRELLEESGYTSDDWMLWKTVKPVIKIIWNVHFFIAKNCTRVQKAHLDAGEKIYGSLLSLEEFLNLSEDDSFKDKELKPFLLAMRIHKKKKDTFSALLFG